MIFTNTTNPFPTSFPVHTRKILLSNLLGSRLGLEFLNLFTKNLILPIMTDGSDGFNFLLSTLCYSLASSALLFALWFKKNPTCFDMVMNHNIGPKREEKIPAKILPVLKKNIKIKKAEVVFSRLK